MKIYFAGSIRGGREDNEIYQKIIASLKKYGEVLTEHVGSKNLSNAGEYKLSDKYIFERDTEWLENSDIIIAEVSTPSLGIGYEIGKMEGKKPILCLYRETNEKKLSAMISGNKNLKVEKYKTTKDVVDILENIITSI